MPRATTRVNPHYPPERTRPDALAVLQKYPWDEPTRAANNSPDHAPSLDRWLKKAREANPALPDKQAERLAQYRFGDHEIRMIDRDGEPWWVALDLCRALGMGHVNRALEKLDADELTKTQITDSAGRVQEMAIVSESGLYSLILRSRKPQAIAFKRWVTHEILPSIRRTGYSMIPAEIAFTAKLAETAHRDHVVPASARVLAYQRWNKPQKGMQAFFSLQLELDLWPPERPAIEGTA